MDYRYTIGPLNLDLEVEPLSDQAFRVCLNGTDTEVAWERIDAHQLHLTVDGRRLNAYLEDRPEGRTVVLRGRTYPLEEADEAAKARGRRKGLRKAPEAVTPPMPAVVVRIAVQPGQEVDQGQEVAVVSAMKMETSLTAPYAGLVRQVNVAQGDKVMPGQILIEIDRA